MPFKGFSRWSKTGLSGGKTRTGALPDSRTEGESIRTALTQWDLDSSAQKDGNTLEENIAVILRYDFNNFIRKDCKRNSEWDSAYSKLASEHRDCRLTGQSILLAVRPSAAEVGLARSYANASSGYAKLKSDADKLAPSAQHDMPGRFVDHCLTAWKPLISNLRSIDIQLSDTEYTDMMSGALPSVDEDDEQPTAGEHDEETDYIRDKGA